MISERRQKGLVKVLQKERIEHEKSVLKAKNEKEVKKLNDSLKRKEKLLKSTRDELERRTGCLSVRRKRRRRMMVFRESLLSLKGRAFMI
jgi:hypothetical protein